MRLLALRAALLGWLALGIGSVAAAAREVTIGYQLVPAPWAVPITEGRLERDTGYTVRWVKFDTGAKVSAAMAAGEVQIGLLGSSPLAAAVSRGLDLQLFWILGEIAAAEALVVRPGSGIDPTDPASLRGRRIATPFVSTAHFHTLFALELWGIEPDAVTLVDLQPSQIVAAWERREIDAAYLWGPSLARLKRTGSVMIDSAVLAEKGRPTFDGLVVARGWAERNRDFLVRLVRTVAEADEAYRRDPAAWTADAPAVKAVVGLLGGDPADVPTELALRRFPTLEEQASARWLGGGAEGGAARTLRSTAEFLKAHGRIEAVLADYARFVTPAFVEAAAKLR
jgi:taurine transport system substrate-binding protein